MLEVVWLDARGVDGSYLEDVRAYGLFKDILSYHAFSHLRCMSFHDVMLARRVQTLQDQDTLLFEIIRQQLLRPSLCTDQFVIDLVLRALEAFQGDLSEN